MNNPAAAVAAQILPLLHGLAASLPSTPPDAASARQLRTIRGAAEMVGLDAFAAVLAEVETSTAPPQSLARCLKALADYLSGLASGNAQDDAHLLAAKSWLQSPSAHPAAPEPAALSRRISDEYVDVFRAEARQHLAAIQRGLHHIDEPGSLAAVRRAVHTLKGAAGLIGMVEASTLAHQLEDLLAAGLDPIRQTQAQALTADLARSCGLNPDAAPAHSLAPRPARPVDLSAAPSIRVPMDYLDELGALSSDLSALRTELARRRAATVDAAEAALFRELTRVAFAMHDCASRMRRAPLASIASRLHRAVRLTAERLDKQACLTIEGETVEMDRGAMEELATGLEHLLRNAVDHGIETPTARIAAGKSIPGQIAIRAFPMGRQVLIEVADDGAGMDEEALLQQAVANQVIAEEDAALLNRDATLELAFAHGVTTAPELSELSGRGIGLAVVKDVVERLGGQLSLESTPGAGTAIRMALPVTYEKTSTLRLIEVGIGPALFLVPTQHVSRVLRLAQGTLEWSAGRAMLRLENDHVPVLRLNDQLDPAALTDVDPRLPVLLVGSGDARAAWIIDRLGSVRELPVRALPALPGPVPGIRGVVVSGNEEPALVLDTEAVLEHVRESVRQPLPATSSEPRHTAPVVYLASKAS